MGGFLLGWVSLSLVLLGGVHRGSAVALSAVAGLGGVFFFRQLTRAAAGLSGFCFVLCLYTLLTAVPVPCDLLAVLSPSSLGDYQSARILLGEGGDELRCHLSLGPSASVLEAAKIGSYGLLAGLSSAYVQRRGLTSVLLAVHFVGVALAALTIGHALLSARSVLGLYVPVDIARPELISLLLNPNNLAGFLLLSVFSGLACLLSSRPLSQKPLVLGGVVLTLGTAILSGSRGAVVALVLGCLSLLWVRPSRSAAGRLHQLALLGLAVLLAGGFAYLASTATTGRELLGDDVSKVMQVPRVLRGVAEYWSFGVGRGAFESVSALLLEERTYIIHRYVENFALSWLIEWGGVVGSLALVGFGWLILPRRLNPRSRTQTAVALVGVYCLLLQNLVDLGLEIPAIAGVLFILLGALEGAAHREVSQRSEATSRRPEHSVAAAAGAPKVLSGRLLSVAFGTTLVLVSVIAAGSSGPSLRAERQAVRELGQGFVESTVSRELFEAALDRALRRWPAEPYFPMVAAQARLARGLDALSWAAATLRRAPRVGVVQLTVADALTARGACLQALLHLRLALAAEPRLEGRIVDRALACSHDLARLRRVAPPGKPGAAFLVEVLRRLSSELSREEKYEVLSWAKELAPDSSAVFRAEGRLLIADADARGSSRLRRLADKLAGSRTCEDMQFRAHASQFEGKIEQALEELSECSSCALPRACAGLRLQIAESTGEIELRREAEKAYVSALCADPESCAVVEEELGQRALSRGDTLSALSRFHRAAERVPTPLRLRRVAEVALSAGQVQRAEHAYFRFEALGGKDEALRKRIVEARWGSGPDRPSGP